MEYHIFSSLTYLALFLSLCRISNHPHLHHLSFSFVTTDNFNWQFPWMHYILFLDLITFISFKFFIELIEGYPVPFAANYTCGNVLALGASMFLCGPKRQFRNMMDERRRVTSITYLSCLASTLACVFIPMPWQLRLIILLILLVTQFVASLWYSLSYIPYGRATALRFIKRTLGLTERSLVASSEEGV